MPNEREIIESSMSVFHYSHHNDPAIFHTSSESVKNQMLRRNANCRIQNDGGEWILTYPASEVRHPRYWIRKSNDTDDTDDD